MLVSQVLDEGANLIEVNGLAKGHFKDWRGRLCMLGSLWEVRGASHDDIRAARIALARCISGGGSKAPALWNDKWWRTKRQVVRKMREAAAAERAREEQAARITAHNFDLSS